MTVNKVILIGNLGQDPEMRYMSNGGAVCNIRLATTESWTKDGQREQRTEWHRVVAFKRLAEIMGQYLRTGSKVYIEGKLKTRKWQDSSGQDRYTTEIVADQMKMLDSVKDHNQERQRPPSEPSLGDSHEGANHRGSEARGKPAAVKDYIPF